VQTGECVDIRYLSPAEFSEYPLGKGESFDFREFSDVGILSRGIVLRYTRDIIENITGHGSRSSFGILTARGDKHLHAPFLIRLFRQLFGIRLSKSLIFAVSDSRFSRFKDRSGVAGERPFASFSIAERKAIVILQDVVGRGFNDISFYDDSRANLEAFKHLAKRYPEIKFKAHFIDPTWTYRLKEFAASAEAQKRLTRGIQSARLILENHDLKSRPVDASLALLQSGVTLTLRIKPVALRIDSGRFELIKLESP